MRTFICLLYFIYSMKVKIVYALSCEVCNNSQFQICHSKAVPCSNVDHVCINVSKNVSSEIVPLQSMLRRQCGKPSQCDLQGTVTSVHLKFTFATACCNTSSCTPPLPTYSPFSEKKSGLLCPTAYNTEGMDNSDEYIMECRENETQCFMYNEVIRTKYFNSSTNISGCTSKDFCKTESFLRSAINSSESLSCTEGFPQKSLIPSFFQKCKFQHEKIKSKPITELCLPDEDVCLSEHMKVEDAGRGVREEHSQRCGRSGQCNLFIVISNSNKTMVINTTCCQTQYCNPPMPNVSSEAEVKNGLTCRSCYTANSSKCNSNSTMFCTGIMDHCVTYTATRRSGGSNETEILIGCGTKDACAYGRSFVGSNTNNLEVNITCTGWRNVIHTNILFVILLASVISQKLF
ncbi:uncharacterized protein [Phyllobates terribilis]|uniref:uncharacterized protein isoform X1 n=1 Tax=Phyllobates terribilis TaxID=111132 RepID=UPI003CCB54E7